jgi:hypothetical protein
VRGDLIREQQILLHNIEVQIKEVKLNAKQWRGQFVTVSALPLDRRQLYKLRLEDGRSGDILITGAAGDTLRFRGVGLLG